MHDETQIEQASNHAGAQDNLSIWGKLYLNRKDRTVAGWLVDSWSTGGTPYWHPKIHWLAKDDGKIYRVYLNIDVRFHAMNLSGEAADIEPERADFIRANVAKWEIEWLNRASRKL
jgi:hypothetical protein